MTWKRITACLILTVAGVWGCGDDGTGPPPPPPPDNKSTSVTLSASKDNTLYEYVPPAVSNDTLFSSGAGDLFFIGKTAGGAGSGGDVPRIRRGLMQFDLSSIPAGSTIDSVCLELFCVRRKLNNAVTVGLHPAQADWGEAGSVPTGIGGAGAPPEVGDATWLHTFFDTARWTTPGGDYSPTANATAVVTQANMSYKWGPTSDMKAIVQGWLDTPSTNHGWVISGGDAPGDSLTAKAFGTREYATAANRPKLKVYYTKP